MKQNKPPITPEMKVAELLESYPELEQALLEFSPAFEKLKNPVLRKTVARVSSLGQAARVSGLPVAVLINQLRQRAGMSPAFLPTEEGTEQMVEIPSEKITKVIDARPLIERGEYPIAKVLGELNKLEKGSVLKLLTPFTPAPLIDLAKKQGFLSSLRTEGDIFCTYFWRDIGSHQIVSK